MNIAQFLDKLPMIADIEIVIAFLPEKFRIADESARHALFQRLDRVSDRLSLWLANQKMNVIGHDHIAEHAQPETASDALERRFKDLLWLRRSERWTAMIAAGSDEMALSGLVEALQSPRHGLL